MSEESSSSSQLGPVRVWALAAGGMVGGGIYIALGVVIAAAAQWAWLSFLIAGVIAVTTAYSYAALSNRYGKSGGAFEFLEEMDRTGWAGSLSWLLIVGYTLTIAVYAYAFGHYVAYALGGGQWAIRGLAVLIGVGLIGLNLVGVGKMTAVEVVIVTANLAILLLLGAVGLANWDATQLVAGIEPRGPTASLVGAAAIFVSYEGFQLLTYDYDQIRQPDRFFLPVLVSAAVFVVLVYVFVALGATMLAGAVTIVEEKQVALSVAAEKYAGAPGLVVMTIAAGFATAAAINSTLYSTAKLVARVADDGELPAVLSHTNRFGVPDRPIIGIGLIATLLSIAGSLSALVEAASLVFLTAFLVVNLMAVRHVDRWRFMPWLGILVGGLVGVVLVARLVVTAPYSLAALATLSLIAVLGRTSLLRLLKGSAGDSNHDDQQEEAS